ncbi:MAG TPA: methyltransferase domain-containing protein [Rugosimonospora sp.]|jgi:2-polyprenyl-3-methyl-5-hydroxy-6-metoxy-1,4-benzoquinol methylase
MRATTEPSRYALNNLSDYANQHHESLAALLDPGSRSRTLELLGGSLAGKTCLEVGAGHGSFALWLADQAGPQGRVTAIDLHPERIPEHDRLTTLQRDVTLFEPVPQGPADFVHTRLMLQHVPQREAVLHWLVSDEILKPGGVLLVEDWDASRTDVVMDAPSPEDGERFNRFQEFMGREVFAGRGTDRTWARRVHGRMVAEGLTDVHTIVSGQAWTGGDVGGRLVAASVRQTYPLLQAAGMTDSELEGIIALLDDPRLVLSSHLMYSTSGTKPVG